MRIDSDNLVEWCAKVDVSGEQLLRSNLVSANRELPRLPDDPLEEGKQHENASHDGNHDSVPEDEVGENEECEYDKLDAETDGEVPSVTSNELC